ncbi:hypothetical protein U0038_17485 [Sphingobacterium spiritivorum]|uniref:Uncharacterized protein n=1 Tax=Sphingobacterium spiritivorum ATCC 33861 TaxID=525373 RepID=D7VN63_SPHSI|nr:hypothetical protein [Sphingobacterium spiritivorum]EFK57360.1 hypothetical protein HMPREF0766_12433 [Sphingobacterium spiritivorum ATCC 33861]QQT36560.1 hypothetical protein I6J01_03775 [Sphingobacterium spiritivorum]WQD33311.1 hypothetical protein U0038_17485 [Sphingobacterium spiritivorum]SUJ22052.1 Uncharacterised protein [Sphingobacterium spiritivorum]
MTQQEIADTFIDSPTHIGSIALPKGGLINKILKRTHSIDIEVGPIPVGKVQQIGVLLKQMTNLESIQKYSQADQINILLSDNINPILQIIAIAISKTRRFEVDTLTAISEQWSMSLIYKAFIEVYRRLDLSSFFDIMALSKNLTLNLFPDPEALGQA